MPADRTPRAFAPRPPSAGGAKEATADPFRRQSPRRPVRRLAFALSRASVVAAVIAATAAAATLAPIGARRQAREIADRELAALLSPGETVLAQAFASQRRPSDLWRLSNGLLVATDRRVLYIAAPPRTLVRPADEGPLELYVESWPYDRAFTMTRLDSAADGRVRIRTPARTLTLRIDAASDQAADSIRQLAAEARQRFDETLERLRETSRPTMRVERYVSHVVRRGETLSSIAVRYNTSVDVLRQLNGLRGDALFAGQQLRVPELLPVTDPFGPDDGDTTPPTGAPARPG